MVEFKYGYVGTAAEKVARAQSYDVDASYKDLCEVCKDIRGTLAEPALTRLDVVAKGLAPVRFRDRHGKRLGHRRELGGRKGRYPRKAARLVRKVLENAVANATSQGISVPYIAHISANKHRSYPRLAPRGRQMRHDYETARIEIVLKESDVERSEAARKAPKVRTEAERLARKEPKALKVRTEAERLARKGEKAERRARKAAATGFGVEGAGKAKAGMA